MTTPTGVSAIKALAEQAMVPEAGNSNNIQTAVQTAFKSCYPLRNYDMSKVTPMAFDNYQQFISTKQ
jgi:hypothetical protein